MKNFLIGAVCLISAIYLGYKLLLDDRGNFKFNFLQEQVYEYPSVVTIESGDGRFIEVELEGRNETYVRFIRKDNRARYDYLISSLSLDSQRLINAYPNTNITIVDVPSRSNQQDDFEDVYIEQLKLRVLVISQEIAELKREFDSTNSNSAKRGYRNKAEKLFKERDELKAKIAERENPACSPSTACPNQ